MAVKLAISTRNARLDAIETDIGTSPKLKIYGCTATQIPASATAPVQGTLLVNIPLPSDWLAAASAGSKAKSGTWSTSAIASGTGRYFRITTSATAHRMQGTVGLGTGDLSLDNNVIANGQAVTISTFTLTDGNA